MDRRAFVAGTLGVLAAPLTGTAQPSGKAPARVGYIGNSYPSTVAQSVEAFRQGLRDLGWIEGQNLVIEYRWAEGNPDRLPALAAELVRLKVDIIALSGTLALRAGDLMTCPSSKPRYSSWSSIAGRQRPLVLPSRPRCWRWQRNHPVEHADEPEGRRYIFHQIGDATEAPADDVVDQTV